MEKQSLRRLTGDTGQHFPPVIGVIAGSGQVAGYAVEAGADLLMVLSAGIYRSASHRRFVRVHGNYSGRASLLEIGDDRNDALQLRFGTYGWSRAEMFGVNTFDRFDPGSRTCRLSADVDNICALIQ